MSLAIEFQVQHDTAGSLHGALRLVNGDCTLFALTEFPLSDLAQELRRWNAVVDDDTAQAFVFAKDRPELYGAVRIHPRPSNWQFSSRWEMDRHEPVPLATVRRVVSLFIDRLEAARSGSLVSHASLRRAFDGVVQPEVVDKVLARSSPAVLLTAQDAVALETLPVGASHFGGDPDLPEGFVWPTREIVKRRGFFRRKIERRSVALDFLAQLDCADLPRAACPASFPESGMLYLFYDTKDQPWHSAPDDAAAQVFFVESAALVRTSAPADAQRFRPCPIRPMASWTLPAGGLDSVVDEDLAQAARHQLISVLWHKADHRPIGQMFGHPQWIQYDPMVEDELWDGRVLLLQIDSDDSESGPGWMWGDSGMLYISMTQDQMQRRSFADTELFLECY